MYVKSKKVKSVVFLTSLIMTASMTTWSGFAAGSSDEMPSEAIGEFSAVLGASSTAIGESSAVLGASSTAIEKSSPVLGASSAAPYKSGAVSLKKSGTYKFVGANATNISKVCGTGVIEIAPNDRIIIKGNGTYNITIKNVNINAFAALRGVRADINLTLVGKNTFKGVLFGNESSSLTITEASNGGSLDVLGIYFYDITINGGKIRATAKEENAIYGYNVTIDGGNITATSNKGDAVKGSNVTIEGGKINATSNKGDAIYGKQTSIDGGNITATSNKGCAICGYNVTIDGGKINATSNEVDAIEGRDSLTIEGGNITATSNKGCAICGYNVTIDGGKIKATSNKWYAICADDGIRITGGKIEAQGQDKMGIDAIHCINGSNNVTGGTIN